MKAKLKLGRTVVTRGVSERMEADDAFVVFVSGCINRHQAGDWGDMCEEDKQVNEQALSAENPCRVMSAYRNKKHEGLPEVWVITEWDRSVTTVLFPEEY